MSTEHRIRIIKLAERKRRAKARLRQGRDSARRPGPGTDRDVANAVTGWVDELQKQKRRDADALSEFNNLFEDA